MLFFSGALIAFFLEVTIEMIDLGRRWTRG
jgi:hypothetical protein